MKKSMIIIAVVTMFVTAIQAQRCIKVQPMPEVYTVKVTHHDATPEITLSGSQEGITYQLYRGGSKKNEKITVGSPIKGTGKPIVLVPQMVGVHSVTAISSYGCCIDMQNFVIINKQDFAKETANYSKAIETNLFFPWVKQLPQR